MSKESNLKKKAVKSEIQKVSNNHNNKGKVVSKNFEIDEVSTILEMVDKYKLTKFELERGGDKLSLSREQEQKEQVAAPQMFAPMVQPQVLHLPQGAPTQGYAPSIVQPQTAAQSQEVKAEDKPATARNLKDVRSPMVGTFYRRPSVDADPYVKEGDMVKQGDVLCILEAMKLMNEIESTVTGRVIEICLEDGQMSEYDEILFRIEPA